MLDFIAHPVDTGYAVRLTVIRYDLSVQHREWYV